MDKFKGIIALDIDGTITSSKDALEPEVGRYLNQLTAEGWRIIFITGRTYSFAKPILVDIEGDFFVAVQNGAALYEMPQEKCVKKNDLSTELLGRLEPLFQNEGTGFLVDRVKRTEIFVTINGEIFRLKSSSISTSYRNFSRGMGRCRFIRRAPDSNFCCGQIFCP